MHAPLHSEYRDGVVRVVPEEDRIVAICLDGSFDRMNAPALGDQIHRALESGNDVVVDLSEATFIDCSVIHVLVRASKAASRLGQGMVLQVATAAIVERVLELTAIEQVVPRARDRKDAVRIVRGGRTAPLTNVSR